MQTCAKLGVAVVLARPTSVVAHIELVTALCHGRDSQVKLSKERTVMCQYSHRAYSISSRCNYGSGLLVLQRGHLQQHSPGIPSKRSCSRWALGAGSQGEVEEVLLKTPQKTDKFHFRRHVNKLMSSCTPSQGSKTYLGCVLLHR